MSEMVPRVMKALFVLFLAIAITYAASSADLEESPHLNGPNGLQGWTLLFALENGERVAGTLVIARRGKVFRRVEGSPLIWKWMFRANGKEIALEAGPRHFAEECVLVNVSTGKELERLDCYHYPDDPPSGGWPLWVEELQKASDE